ncbi:hypothetical protein MD484_g4983, partial [Candolleomyces efflorescens]
MTSLFGISTSEFSSPSNVEFETQSSAIYAVWHTGLAIYRKMWWIFPTVVLCGALESLGWSARNWSHSEPNNLAPFQIQIIATIIAPTPLLAATFVIFGEIIRRIGQTYSRLSPRTYTVLFCTFDVISLVVQGLGGGLAATADPLTNGRDPELGARVMLAGIAFQLELADGWNGRIIRTELYFNVLDGAMVVLAIYTLNIVHPSCFVFTPQSATKKDEEKA